MIKPKRPAAGAAECNVIVDVFVLCIYWLIPPFLPIITSHNPNAVASVSL